MKRINIPFFLASMLLAFSASSLYAAESGSSYFDEIMNNKYAVSTNNILENAMIDTKYEHIHGVEWDARLKIIKGNAVIKPKNSLKMTKHSPGSEIPLIKGDLIKVYPGSEAELRLYDKAIFKLFPNMEIEIISIEKTGTYLDLKYGYLVGKTKRFTDRKHSLKLKTLYTNSKIISADFAVGYVKKNNTTGIAVFDKGIMSVSTINEKGLSLGLYELKNNSEIVYSAALPDKDEEGHSKDDPDYKMKDIDIHPGPIEQLKELQEKQAEISKIAANMKKEWAKYEEGQRDNIREQILSEGDIMIPAPVISKNKKKIDIGNETNDPDAKEFIGTSEFTDKDFKIK
ncbi:MAG: hypothetical protein J5706_02925 [Elusimicrobiales bacterium]|nr:hypothetical protein [Elusimicrobiales bacterium]